MIERRKVVNIWWTSFAPYNIVFGLNWTVNLGETFGVADEGTPSPSDIRALQVKEIRRLGICAWTRQCFHKTPGLGVGVSASTIFRTDRATLYRTWLASDRITKGGHTGLLPQSLCVHARARSRACVRVCVRVYVRVYAQQHPGHTSEDHKRPSLKTKDGGCCVASLRRIFI